MPETIRILYVDDNADDRQLVRSSLEQKDSGFQLTLAKTGKEFESMLTRDNYDLVISDLQISGYDNFKIIDYVKSYSSGLPLIILTRTISEQIAIEAIKRGAIDYVIKSDQNIQHLSIIIKVTLEKKRSQIAQEIIVQTLHDSEARFRDIFEKATDGMLLADIISKKFILSNPNLCRMLGYSSKEILKLSVADIHPPESLHHVISEFERQASGEVTSVLNIPVIRKDESVFYADINSYPFYWGGKKYLMGIFRDITQRKQTEDSLHQSEIKYKQLSKEFKALLDAIPDKITLLSVDLKIIWFNKAVTLITSKNNTEVIGEFCYKIWCEKNTPCERCPVIRTLATGLPETEIIKTGDGKYWDLRTVPIQDDTGKITGVIEVGRDITDQKIAEENLRENESKFRAVADTSVATIVIYQNDKYVYLNPAAEAITGYSKSELMEKNFWDIIHPDYRDLVRARGIARIEGKPVTSRYEFKIIKKNGDVRWLDFGAGMIQYRGKPAAIGVAFDVTDRKEAEEALRVSEKKYRLLHESMTDAFATVNMDGKIIEFNNAYISMLGYTAEEIVNLSYIDITPEKWHAYESKIVSEQVLSNGFSEVYEKEYRRKDGTIFPIELRTFLIRDENRKPESMWAIVRDITGRKRAEEELNQSLEQMRQLSARFQSIREEESTRIAREIHDELGQTLTGIKMDISFLEERLTEILNLQENPQLIEKINSISNLTDSAVQTIRKITTALRPAILDSMGLSAAIEWQTEDFEHRTGITCRYFSSSENFEVGREVSTAIFRIMQEALTNITRHAKASHVTVKLEKRKDNIFFKVTDNGTGFKESELNNLNSFGILGMKERCSLMGGIFEIRGEPGIGTTIRVTIPLHSSTMMEPTK